MKKKGGEYEYLKAKRATSFLIVWLLVASGFLLVFPISQPTAFADKDHTNSAQWEDQNFGGGLDYNGDPAGDMKVTWHNKDNNHTVSNNFIVQDGYILEIEAGAEVRIDPGFVIQVGQDTTGATMFVNGTPVSPVLLTQNVTGSAWEGIYILTRSYVSFNYTDVSGANVIYVGAATMNMTNSSIINMGQFGIYALSSSIFVANSTIMDVDQVGIYAMSSSSISVFNSTIMNVGQVGIYAASSSANVMDSTIINATSYAIGFDSSNAVVDNNDIWGYNGSAGSLGGIDGGGGIYLAGSSLSITISNNRIYGGNGGDDMLGSGGGFGGHGIYDNSYNGDLSIIGNEIIMGGRGGNNTTPMMSAGDGGMGIQVIPVPDIATVDISGNNAILGGNGGDNLALSDGNAGEGNHSIMIIDNPAGSDGTAIISYNDLIMGGNGGQNNADWNIMGWTAGNGGHGILTQDIRTPCSLTIEENPVIAGGNGGDNTGSGGPGSIPSAGEGGNGILLWKSTNVLISKSSMFGGDGGNNALTGIMVIAGDAGNGILLYSDTPTFITQADINNSNSTGGNGGDDWAGGTFLDGCGEGGNALFSQYGSGACTSSYLYGGMGGHNYGVNPFAGEGGTGVGLSGSTGWIINGGSIIGGRGGDNFNPSGGGGNGSSAIYIGGNSDFITVDSVLSIIGGDGGNADTGYYGPGNASRFSIYATSSSQVIIFGNNIRPGIAGYNATSDTYGKNGTYGIYGTNLGIMNAIIGNDITTYDTSGNTYGIWLDPSVAQISGNDIYENNIGVYILNSNAVTIGDNNDIYNNSVGIYLDNSDASIGSGNIISSNDHGIYLRNSNPTITGNQIINSNTIGLRYTLGSNGIVERCTIENSGERNIYCEGLSSPKIYNSTMVASVAGSEFFITGDSHPWLLNTTLDKTKTVITDAASNLTVNWYLNVRVVEPPNVPVEFADVWVNDTYGTNLFTGQTPADGWIRWLVVTEYVETQTGGKYYYTPHNISAAEGARSGLEITDMDSSKNVVIVLGGTKFNTPLKKGWNLISIPINMTDTGLENVLSNIEGNYLAVQWFNISDIKDHWKHYHVKKAGLNDLLNIERIMGVWIYMKTDDTLTVAGFDPDPVTNIELKPGWNMVGYPTLTTRNAGISPSDAFFTIASEVDMVMYYNASDTSDPWKAYDPGSYSPDDLVQIEAGFGLYIHVTADCTWTINW